MTRTLHYKTYSYTKTAMACAIIIITLFTFQIFLIFFVLT